ncbi:MAG: tRNA (N(6)-L-threonylcarbamoyladenosine(37)-C(2))-methylthiotransferase MtaB [Firmicutes bacterium]|nr:tRNA (N(6)-L-threonylcarbamoyladenosine(37)-C(2))-methylthiotransferase MtaB [Bacillota bacterium]
MRVALFTLGCKANQYDTATMADLFRRHGYEIVPFPAPAEIYVINTCSVTAEAVRKSRQLVRRAYRANPQGVVVLTGCYAQTGTEGEHASLPEAVLVVGPQDRGKIVDLVEAYLRDRRPRRLVRPPGVEPRFLDLPAPTFAEHTRAWLKIEDGCDQRCAYCQIPLARGPVRSLPLPRVLEEAGRLLAAGYRELVLTGIHLGAYGHDLGDGSDLARVVETLDSLPGLVRLRLGSIEPNDFSPRLIAALGRARKVAPHLHIPLQSGADRVLTRMGRPYRAADYAARLQELREAVPGLAVSTDLMVGFPGESEEDFAASLAFAAEMGFSRMHVFPFSPRPGTRAASFPDQIPRRVRDERARTAIELAGRLALRFHRTLLGRELVVLVEEKKGDLWRGLAGQYVETRFPGEGALKNRLVVVRGREAHPWGVLAGPPERIE